jgi:hypothetical protein
MVKMKKFMMADGRFGCALVNCCDVDRIVRENEYQTFYTSRCSREISFVNDALHRHYRTKRMTNLKFELSLRMQCVRFPRIDGMAR